MSAKPNGGLTLEEVNGNESGGKSVPAASIPVPTRSGGRIFNPESLDRVVILGMGRSVDAWMKANYENPQPRDSKTQVWTINSGCLVHDHDVVFNMHDLGELEKIEPEKRFRQIYMQHNKPVVTVTLWEGAPRDRIFEYPLAEVIAAFNQSYFATGISYMIACALLAGVKDLWIFGADYDYADKTDYEAGRANVEFWLGIASALGVRITTPASTTLLDTRFRVPGGKGAVGFGAVYGYFERQPVVEATEAGMRLVAFERAGEDFASLENEIEGALTPNGELADAEKRSGNDPNQVAGPPDETEDRRGYPH